MPLRTVVKLRQPARHDLVGRRFTVTGIGAGFEGTIGIRVVNGSGRELARTFAQSSGGGTLHGEFSTEVRITGAVGAGVVLTVQAFGDNPGLPDEGPFPGFNLQQVRVIAFPKLLGWLEYRVERGDTLTSIAREHRVFGRTSVAQIDAANPAITDPDEIRAGQRIRIPISS